MTTATGLYIWRQAGWGYGLMLLMPNRDSAISMTEPGFIGPGKVCPPLNCPVLVIAWPLEPLLVFSWQRRSPVWVSAANRPVVTRTDGVVWLRDSVLHTTNCAVTCLFVARPLACTILAVLLQPLINVLFSPTGLHVVVLFVTLLCVKSPGHVRFWGTVTGAPDNAQPCSKSLRSLVLPILTFNRTVTEWVTL
jgi:hypothetical protein